MAPDPNRPHPMPQAPQVTFLQPLARGLSNVQVGRYAYYDDADGTGDFFSRNVLHHFDFVGDRLLTVAWWDWPIERIDRNLDAIWGADIAALDAAR
jgi:hypothetical protein